MQDLKLLSKTIFDFFRLTETGFKRFKPVQIE